MRFFNNLVVALMLIFFTCELLAQSTEPVLFDSSSNTGSISGSKKLVVSGPAISSDNTVEGRAFVVKDNGSSSNRVDIVFLGDGYASVEQADYAERVSEYANGVFLQDPFLEYQHYFNIHRVELDSVHSGIDHEPSFGTLKDTILDSQYWCQGVESTLCTDITKAWNYAALARDFDQIVVLVNSELPGTAAYPFSDLSVLAANQDKRVDNFLHVFGHSFGNLADEYDSGSWPTYTGFEPAEPNVSAQNAAAMTLQSVKWVKWLGAQAFGSTIDTYEGAMGSRYGIFRPTLTSKMKELNQPFNAPSVEALIKEVYRHVKPIDDATSANTNGQGSYTGQNTFFVKILNTKSDTVKVKWFIDGTEIPGATGTTFRPNNYQLSNGTKTITAKVVDTTPWMKDENFRAQKMSEQRSWQVVIDQRLPVISEHPKSASKFPGQTVDFSVKATGEEITYQWYKNGNIINGATGPSISVVPVLREHDKDEYYVVVSNIAGSVRSNTAVLTLGNRAPSYFGQNSIETFRGASAGFSYTVTDLDNDTTTVRGELDSAGTASGAKLLVSNSQLDLTVGNSYLGSYTINLTISDGKAEIKVPIQVSVKNRIPTLTTPASQTVFWNQDFVIVELAASDADPMDTLVYSAALGGGTSAPVQLSVQGNKVKVDPQAGYVGQFVVSGRVTDGLITVAREFSISWSNSSPSLAPVSSQRMFYKNDKISVPVSASDPNDDALTLSARVVSGYSGLQLSFDGNNLIIDPPALSQATSQIEVTATDGKLSSSQRFSFESYNTAPVIAPIPNQNVSPQKNSIQVPISVTDADGDQTTIQSSLNSTTNEPVKLEMSANTITLSTAGSFTKDFSVKVTASDGNKTSEAIFSVVLNNSAPVFGEIDTQYMHPVNEDAKTVMIVAADPDGDTITYKAYHSITKNNDIATISNTGRMLTVNPVNKYIGSIPLILEISDGTFKATKVVTFTTYNNAPEITPICNRFISSSNLPASIPFTAKDIDSETLTYEVFVEPSSIAVDLDSKYNFSAINGYRNYNVFGMKEKYLNATVNGTPNTLVFITQDNKLYKAGESFNKSTYLEDVQSIFYENPLLLVDAVLSTEPGITASVVGSELKINRLSNYTGLATIRLRAKDSFTFDEESFVVGLGDLGSGNDIDLMSDIRSHWTEDKIAVEIPVLGSSTNYSNISVKFFEDTTALTLDRMYQFSYLMSDDQFLVGAQERPADNKDGLQEKYFIGLDTAVQSGTNTPGQIVGRTVVYSIVPNGTIRRYTREVFESTDMYRLSKAVIVGTVAPIFYRNLNLLLEPPSANEPNINLRLNGKILTIDSRDQFIGRAILEVNSGKSYAGSQLVIFDRYNSVPAHSKITGGTYSYRTNTIVIPVSASDSDSQDAASLTKKYTVEVVPYSRFDSYNLVPDFPIAKRYNEDGWREVKLEGTYQNTPSHFAILPSGALFANWNGSPQTSTYVTHAGIEAYRQSQLLDGRWWTADFIQTSPLRDTKVELINNNIHITLPQGYKEQMGRILVVGRAYDGLSMGESYDRFEFWNSQTITQPVPQIDMHWRETSRQVGLSSTDADGQDDIKPTLTVSSLPINNGNPGRLSISGTPFQMNLGLAYGVARTFDFSITTEDWVGAGSTRPVKLQVYNNPPTINDFGTVPFSYTSTSNKVTPVIADIDSADQSKLKTFVINGTIPDNVGNLIAQYKLKNNSQIAYNTSGSLEQHLTGELDGKAQEFIILQNGALYAWNGSFDPEQLLGFFPAVAWGNFNMYASAQPKYPSIARATINNNVISFERNNAPVNTNQTFTIVVSDGVDYASKPLYAVWRDNAPVLPPGATYSGHWRNGAITVPGFPAVDADGDPITYTLTGSNNAGYTQEIVNGELKVTPKPSSALTHTVVVRAQSTNNVVSTTYAFNFTNNAPVFLNSTTVTASYKESVTITPNVVDPNQDPLTIQTVLLEGAIASKYKAVIIGNSVKIEPTTATAGTLLVNVFATDTVANTKNTYIINFVNRPPTFTKIPSIQMKWSDKTKSAEILATDPDNDIITYTATVANGIANAQIANGNISVNLLKYAPVFDIKVTATDGVHKIDTNMSVQVQNVAPVMSGLPSSKSVHWRTDSFSIPLTSADSDGDTLTFDAKILETTFPATANVSNGTLVVSMPEKKVGKFTTEVGLSDGVVRSISRMAVEVTNTAPKLGELANIFLEGNSGTYTINTLASDANNDPLTLTAKVITSAHVAYEFNAVHNFFIGSANFNFNRLGNAEKYLKGRRAQDSKDNDYVIYPSGRMYIWSGALSTSTYLGTVPLELYQDPSKFIGAAASTETVQGVTTSVSGNSIILNYQPNYMGTVWVQATVTDTKDSSSIFFSVTKDNATDAGDASQCGIIKNAYEGDYQYSGTPLFTAHARIGDSLLPLLTGSYELAINKNLQTSFKVGETANYGWQSNKKVNFSVTYDSENKQANFTLGGTSVRHTVADDFSPTDVLFKLKRSFLGSSMTVSDLLLNGKQVDASVYVSDLSNMSKALKVRAVTELNKKFTVEGSLNISHGLLVLKDSDLDLQITLLKSENAPTNCSGRGEEDDDSGDGEGEDQGTGKKVVICHIPSGDFSKAKTLSIGKSALTSHLAHGDIIGACPGQPQDPGDPASGGATCEHKKVITSPNYTFWNSFLNMMNILELVNGTNKDIVVKVNFYSISGTLFDQRYINVPANNQFDLIVNDLHNFVKDSYGIIKLEFEGNLDGRMAFYRPSSDNTGYDYAFTVPLIDATFGTTAVSFNTYQPSFKPEEANNQVANWLSIVNLDSELRSFTVLTYDTPGRLIMRREVDVPSFGRMDIDGGHGIVGPNVVGYHKIIPKNVTGEYITQLTRYGGNSPAGFAPSQFKFAVPLSSKLGQSDPQYMPISNKFGETNWIEVINVLDKAVGASINYYASNGQLLESVDAYIGANAQMHFEASRRLPVNSVGYAVVVPFEPFSIVAQSMGYLREKSAGSVTAVYGTQSRRIVPCMQAGSYNLYLNMQNYVLVANPTNETVEATVSFSTPSSIAKKKIVLTAKSAMQIPIHNNTELRTSPNTYGLISVYPKDPSIKLFSEVLRLRYRANGNPDFAMSVPIR